MVDDDFNFTDGYVAKLIKWLARLLLTYPGFTSSDRELIESDLWHHLLEQQKGYVSSRSSFDTFADRILKNKASDILRDRCAQCRDPRREAFSVNGTYRTSDDKVTSIHETIASPHPDAFRLDDLDDDLVTLFERSMGVDRKVLAGKHAGQTHKEIQNDHCLSRRQFDAAWSRICATAKELRLDEYLADKRAASTRNRVHEL